MVNVQRLIFDIFEAMDLPYYRQGSFGADDQYPPSFFTFWNLGSPFGDYGDNQKHSITTTYAIFFYTNDPAVIDSKLTEFIARAENSGFIVGGNGSDATSDDKSFIGRKVDITYKENLT